MYVERVPNRNSPPAILIRESYREGGRVKKRTLANISHLGEETIKAIQTFLKGGVVLDSVAEAVEVLRTLPHGHVVAALGTIRNLSLDALLGNSKEAVLVLAMIVSRIIAPASKLATARGLSLESATTSLPHLLELGDVDEDALYGALDWLLGQQKRIEDALASRHLQDGSLVLYDVTSTYFEGTTCPLAHIGYNRDQKKGKRQIVIGLLCSAQGCPICVEVFDGNVADPQTLKSQILKVRERFGLERVIFVGDRGMITEARLREDIMSREGLDWITALRAPSIKKLVQDKAIQVTLFDTVNMAEVSHPDYPGQRLIVCRNPLLARQRAHKRLALLEATETQLERVRQATLREKRRLKGKDKIALRVGKIIDKYKVAKHFKIHIDDDSFHFERDTDSIAQEAALDGLYVIRTSVPKAAMEADQVVRAYKDLSQVEQAFRSLKTIDLQIRPIFHRLSDRVRAHVFLCFLAYYVVWHMRRLLAPVLFDDDDPAAAEEARKDPVAPALRSASAERKAQTKRTAEGLPVHSFQTLMEHLGTLCLNTIRVTHTKGMDEFTRVTSPTKVQQKALELLGVSLLM
ncbi:IS1634 family transposase [Desulfosoma sp.]